MNKKFIVFGITAVVALTIIVWPKAELIAKADTVELDDSVNQAQVRQVTVMQAGLKKTQVTLKGFGEVNPEFQLVLKSQVAGQVVALNKRFVTGGMVKKGERLLSIEKSNYLQQLASAESALAQAEVDLLMEKRESVQAKDEWQRSGLAAEPSSALTLRKPQLKAAMEKVNLAKAQLATAKLMLSYTEVTAPYDAVVSARAISLGSSLNVGDEIATLLSSQKYEVTVPLTDNLWSLMSPISSKDKHKVVIQNNHGDKWFGYIARTEQFVDAASRQRKIVVAVDKPMAQNPKLFAGSYVTVLFDSKEITRLWQLPNSSLTRSGYFWYVDDNNKLQRHKAALVYQANKHVFVEPIAGMNTANILIHPLDSYVPDTDAVAVEEKR